MNEALLYVANSAAWSVGGLIVGFLLGRAGRDVHDIKEAVTKEEPDDDDDNA